MREKWENKNGYYRLISQKLNLNKSFQDLGANISSYYQSKINPNKQNQLVKPVLTISLVKKKNNVWLQLFLCLQVHSILSSFFVFSIFQNRKSQIKNKSTHMPITYSISTQNLLATDSLIMSRSSFAEKALIFFFFLAAQLISNEPRRKKNQIQFHNIFYFSENSPVFFRCQS